MTDTPTTPEACRAESSRVLALLEGITPGKWEYVHHTNSVAADYTYEGNRHAAAWVADMCQDREDEVNDGYRTFSPQADKDALLIAAAPDITRAYLALLDAHAEALERERWIPVSERLPEESVVDILALFKTGDVYPVVVSGEGDDMWFKMYCSDTHIGYFKPSDLTHWRPLPAPPAPASAEGAHHD